VSSVESTLESASSSTKIDTNITQESDQYSNAIGNTEDYYYSQMKEAWQKAQEYRDSISDPEVKNAVQTPEGAVNGKYTELLELYPNDKQQIENAYQWVIRGQ
jgi:CHASE3 domain sensor protein